MYTKKCLYLIVIFTLILTLCFSTFVYAASSPYIQRDIVKTEQDDDKKFVEKATAIVVPSGTTLGGWSISGSGDTEHPITMQKDDITLTQGTIQIKVGADVHKIPLFGNIMYSAEQGYAITLSSYLDKYSTGSDFFVSIIDTKGVVHDVGKLDMNQKVTSADDPGFLETWYLIIKEPVTTVATFVEEILVELILCLADGVLYIISKCVGEPVTLSRIVFNKISKVSIDYWNVVPGTTSVSGMMAKVVVPWYSFFKQIAVIVYMISLLIIGIKIMFSSTANQTAQFKESVSSWIVGVALLMFFPYAMKYIVFINNTMVESIENYIIVEDGVCDNPCLLQPTYENPEDTFGTSAFVEGMIFDTISSDSEIEAASITDSMMRIRIYAQYKKKIALAIVYVIMLGQMLILLFSYYKRAFMIAFLITLFPLVAMTYVLDKMGDKKAQSFEIWFKEFVINVIIQLFHAVIFAVIVGVSVQRYIINDTEWLFMILSTIFMFQGEKILKGIFNVKSSANTLADLAVTGAAAMGIARKGKKIFGGEKDSNASKEDKKESKDIQERRAQRTDMHKKHVVNPDTTTPSPSPTPSSSDEGSDGSYDRNSEPEGVGTPGENDTTATIDDVLSESMKSRFSKGLLARGVRKTGDIAFGLNGAVAGLANSRSYEEMSVKALGSAISARMIGRTVTKPIVKGANKIEQVARGNKVAKQIEQGKYDKDIEQFIPADVDPNEIIGKNGETVQEIYSKALAELARVSATKGAAKGRVAFWEYIDENTKNNS